MRQTPSVRQPPCDPRTQTSARLALLAARAHKPWVARVASFSWAAAWLIESRTIITTARLSGTGSHVPLSCTRRSSSGSWLLQRTQRRNASCLCTGRRQPTLSLTRMWSPARSPRRARRRRGGTCASVGRWVKGTRVLPADILRLDQIYNLRFTTRLSKVEWY